MGKKTLKQLASESAGSDRSKCENEQDFLFETMKGIAGLEESVWDELDREVQNWYNGAIDAHEAHTDLPSLGDEEETFRKRGAGPARRQIKDSGSAGKKIDLKKIEKELSEGDKVSVETARKTIDAKVLKVSEKYLKVEDSEGKDSNIAVSRIKSVTVAGGAGTGTSAPAPAKIGGGTREVAKEDIESIVGSDVTVTTSKGDIFGKLTSANDKMIKVETEGGEEKIAMRRVKSVSVAGGSVSSAAAVAIDDPEYQKKADSIREAIAISPTDSQDDILASLEEDDHEGMDAIIAVVYHDMHSVMKVLREQEMLAE